MTSRSNALTGVGEVAHQVAASLAALSRRPVTVTDLAPHDATEETAQAAAFLALPLEPPPTELIRVTFTVDTSDYTLIADPTADRCTLTRQLALDLADQVHEAEQGNPFPPCPDHQHPLTLARAGSELNWICPSKPRRAVATLSTGFAAPGPDPRASGGEAHTDRRRSSAR